MLHGNHRLNRFMRKALCLGTASFLALIAGCGSNSSTSSSKTSTAAGPQTYFAPPVAGDSYNNVGGPSALFTLPQTFTIDDQADTFSQATYGIPQLSDGPQVLNAGDVSTLQRGLRELSIETNYASNGSVLVATTPASPESGFAVELANQAGALVQIYGQPAVPAVAATQCPSFSFAQSYQFITIPDGLNTNSVVQYAFNPAVETAYGSVDIRTSGSSVTFQNIQQYTIGSVAVAQALASASTVTGSCASTNLGYTTLVPGQLVVTDPGLPDHNTPPQASIGIGPSGLLVEYNGASTSGGVMPNSSPALYYDNVLGAGTGAVGLPKPSASSPLSISGLAGAQYLGFIDGAGIYVSSGKPATGWSSHPASFGFAGYPALPSACSTFAAQTGALVNGIYGGDFPQANGQDNPSASPNCDFAIELGAPQDSSNSLYPNAHVWVGATYAANPTCNTTCADYSFPAVAIAGQLGGKYAIFLIGKDSTQPWAVYLLQSN
jgi:hypothetical protein